MTLCKVMLIESDSKVDCCILQQSIHILALEREKYVLYMATLCKYCFCGNHTVYMFYRYIWHMQVCAGMQHIIECLIDCIHFCLQ